VTRIERRGYGHSVIALRAVAGVVHRLVGRTDWREAAGSVALGAIVKVNVVMGLVPWASHLAHSGQSPSKHIVA
jgi:hypothetical protein